MIIRSLDRRTVGRLMPAHAIMRPIVRVFLFAAFSGALAAAPATENPLTLYSRAAMLERAGNLAEAQVLMERSFRLALAAGQTSMAKSAGCEAALLLNNTHRMPEAGRMAREVLALDQAGRNGSRWRTPPSGCNCSGCWNAACNCKAR